MRWYIIGIKGEYYIIGEHYPWPNEAEWVQTFNSMKDAENALNDMVAVLGVKTGTDLWKHE